MKRPWRLWVSLLLLGLIGSVSWLQQQAERLYADPATGAATVAIARATESPIPDAQVEAMVRQAVSAAGGLSAVVQVSDTVVLKPNLVWDALPGEGYTTDPRVVRALVRMAREAGAGQVIVADGAAQYRDGHDARGATVRAFRVCGYDANGDMVDDETGAPLVDLNDTGGLDQHDPALVTQVNIPNGLIWNSYWLPRVVMEADVVIGVPVLKNHFLAGVTLGLKNQIGIAPSDIYHSSGSNMFKGQLEHGPDDLKRHIVDLNLARRLDFVVVDGLRGMTDGPIGGTLIDPPMRLILAGADAVAVDTVGALVMGYDPATIPYLGLASNAGLGTSDVSQITVRGARVSQARRDFPAPYGNPPAQRAESTPPAVHLTAPTHLSFVTTTTTVRATAEDDRAVARVEFYAGDDLLAIATSAPYQATVDLSQYQGQVITLRAIAYDRALNDAEDSVTVTVLQSVTPGAAMFQVASIAIPTYSFAPYLQIRSNGPYTYHWLDWGNYDPFPIVPYTYTLLVMENDYLRVTLLPELGGRVYQMIFKPTGHNELYQNLVLKPTHWGPTEQGWWLAVGGIEWGLPVDEHGYEWGRPWAWSVVTSTAGITVTVRDAQATDRLRAAIDLFLPADRAYLQVSPHLENPTAADVNAKFWLNAMLAPGAANTVGHELRWIFNSPEMAVHSTGDAEHFGWCAGWTHTTSDCSFPWPFHEGVNFSRLGDWREWLGFFEHPHAAADFIGVYDTAADEGVARVFPSNIARGVKGFGMGRPNSSYQIDPGTWTDDGSTYVELHGGVAPAFWDWATFPAGQSLTWHEYWYPIASTGVFSAATSEAALALRQSGGDFIVSAHSTAARSASESKLFVWDRVTCAQLARWDVSIDPAQPFSASLPVGGRAQENISVVYLDGRGNTLAAIRPINCQAPDARVEPLPSFVESATFTVTWVRPENVTGVGTFQVQVRDGEEGMWTDWLSSTHDISGTFTGQHGHTYFFRARTIAPQQGTWGDEDWQAFMTVLTEPAPVLITSRKSGAWSTMLILSDTELASLQVISYSVLISNTGNLAANAAITDATPMGLAVLTETLTADRGPQPVWSGESILWTGTVTSGEFVRLSYALSPTATIQRGDRFTNTATIVGSILGPITRQVVMVVPWQVWLPVVVRP